jgi:hypothetical protein
MHASIAAHTTPRAGSVRGVTTRPVVSHASAQRRLSRTHRTSAGTTGSPRQASAQLVHVAAQSKHSSTQPQEQVAIKADGPLVPRDELSTALPSTERNPRRTLCRPAGAHRGRQRQ